MNGGVRTTNIFLLHEITEKTCKKKKKSWINFLIILENNLRLAAMWEACIQKNGWISVRTVRFMVFQLTPVPYPFLQLHSSLENEPLSFSEKTNSLAVTRGSTKGLELFQSHIHKDYSLFNLSGGSLEDLTCQAVCIWPDLEFSQLKRPSHRVLHLPKEITGNCLTSWLPEVMDNDTGKQYTNQKS